MRYFFWFVGVFDIKYWFDFVILMLLWIIINIGFEFYIVFDFLYGEIGYWLYLYCISGFVDDKDGDFFVFIIWLWKIKLFYVRY